MEKKLKIDFASTIGQFERAIKKFRMKRIIYKTIFRGKGLEFDAYRDFLPDDDAEMIDWKASLRANKLLAKQYIEERDFDIYFVVDISNSMLFGSGAELKSEYAGVVIAALSRLILNSDDNVGLVLFNKEIVKFIPPTNSKKQFGLIIRELENFNNYGGDFKIRDVINYLLKVIKNDYSIVFLVSDFIHLDKGLERELKLLSSRFETVGIMVRDILDEELPKVKEQLILQDPYSNRQILVDPVIAGEKYKQIALKQKRIVQELFKDSNIDLLDLKTNESPVIPMVRFLSQRAKGGGE